ncbi:MAG TPA: AI-2E family transporter [Chitinophagaceae bacterium]
MSFNERIKRILLLMLILFLVVISVKQLSLFMPGLLGAVTLYILSRRRYFQLIYQEKWKKGLTAWLYLLSYFFLLGIPVLLAITLVGPEVRRILNDPTTLINNIRHGVQVVQDNAGIHVISDKSFDDFLENLAAYLPTLINSTANILTNLIIMLFMLYYLLWHGSDIEKNLFRLIPLKNENTSLLAAETRNMVRANALGIPLISIIQGLTAMLGYWIFKAQEPIIWGVLTGLFAFFPIVGTMVVWVPLVIYMYAAGEQWNATGLLIYSLIVTGNVDYLARITIMRKIGNVHPVITVLGVIVGLGLFGFIGLIFGPLLINYIIILTRIYISEFSTNENGNGKPANETSSEQAAK